MNNRKKVVIGFCGFPGSGKSTAIGAIKNLGTVISMGNLIRKEAKKMNIPETEKNLGKISKVIRKKEGEEILATKCVDIIQRSDDKIFFIDGLRSWEEVEIFLKRWKFPIIAIKTNIRKRFNIISKRNRIDDPKTLKELKRREQREIELGLKDVIKRADYKIRNSSTKEALRKKTIKIVKKIIEKKDN
ncbi:MAG: hypothetical protein EU518_00830 [Promethearchaeota archaeon]|nr:MAG: hypothetical protein EU518_00830 [Candidatus Lokiarchaeota archaeon]